MSGQGERPTVDQVKATRSEARLTQVEAADLVGLSVKQWQNIEQGIRRMRAGTWSLFKRQAAGLGKHRGSRK